MKVQELNRTIALIAREFDFYVREKLIGLISIEKTYWLYPKVKFYWDSSKDENEFFVALEKYLKELQEVWRKDHFIETKRLDVTLQNKK